MISLMFDQYSVWILEMKNENQVLICYVRFLHHWNQDEQTNPLIQFLSSNSKIIYSSRAYCKISKLYGWTYWRKGILEYTELSLRSVCKIISNANLCPFILLFDPIVCQELSIFTFWLRFTSRLALKSIKGAFRALQVSH